MYISVVDLTRCLSVCLKHNHTQPRGI